MTDDVEFASPVYNKRTMKSDGRRRTLKLAVVLVLIIGGAAATVIATRQSVVARPYISHLERAPKSAQPLIQTIAKRNDDRCYPGLINQHVSPSVIVTKHNFQKYDYVEVDSVVNSQTLIFLTVSCNGGGEDTLQLTPTGWQELGIRQM
jgi:hypothetical protein